jgi:hypothetical protein
MNATIVTSVTIWYRSDKRVNAEKKDFIATPEEMGNRKRVAFASNESQLPQVE